MTIRELIDELEEFEDNHTVLITDCSNYDKYYLPTFDIEFDGENVVICIESID